MAEQRILWVVSWREESVKPGERGQEVKEYVDADSPWEALRWMYDQSPMRESFLAAICKVDGYSRVEIGAAHRMHRIESPEGGPQ